MTHLIVLVEDDPQNARMAKKLLNHAGHDVLVATDGESGLEMIVDNQPDLVLMDLGLPDIDGQTAIAMLRQHEGFQNLPIIAFTAYPIEFAQSTAQAYGCVDVITKPINSREFVSRVVQYLPTN